MKASNLQFSKLLSYILHPLLIATLAILALMLRTDLYSIVMPLPMKFWFLSLVIIFTLLIPSTSVLILLKLNAIYSVELIHRSERTIPLLITSASYMALTFLLKPVYIPPVFLYVIYSATIALLAGLLINMVYKISLHTLGWSAMATTLVSISLRLGIPFPGLISIAVILAGLAGYARLKENAHNQTQVYLGYVAGVSIIMAITLLN